MKRLLKQTDLLLLVALFVACTVAVAMFREDYSHPEMLWRGDVSDRNEHFDQGLRYAIALNKLDFRSFFHELSAAKFYPPFHGLVLSILLLAENFDFSTGVIPSLIGWVWTAVITTMITSRFFADRIEIALATSTAFLFAIFSPTFRFLANDVMLECLGSALTASAIYFQMLTCRRPDSALIWRALAITLVLLFFEKYNYFVLAAIALALTYLLQHADTCLACARFAWRDWRRIVVAISRDPAILVSAVLLLLVLYFYWRGPKSLNLIIWHLSVYPPRNLLTAVYAILWGRLVVAWFQHRTSLENLIGLGGRTILYWLIAPISILFLLPGRLPWFLFAVGPTNSVAPPEGLLSGAIEYARGLAYGFTVGPWAAAMVVMLTMIAFARWRCFPAECRVVFLLLATCAMLVIIHPNHQARFLASWIFALWVCAGAGAGLVFRYLARLTKTLAQRASLAIAAIAALAIANGMSRPSPVLAAAYAHQTPGPNDFDLIPELLTTLAPQQSLRRIGFLPDQFENRNFLRWNIEVQCRCLVDPDTPGYLTGMDQDHVTERILDWTNQTTVHVIVGVFGQTSAIPAAWLLTAMNAQTRFRVANTIPVPSHGATLVVWQRLEASN